MIDLQNELIGIAQTIQTKVNLLAARQSAVEDDKNPERGNQRESFRKHRRQ